MKICTINGCPELTHNTRCTEHDRARGSRHARGYNTTHDQLRRQWATRVATETVHCARCGRTINPTQPWDLGHTDDRTRYNGPEHATCNCSAAGHKAHQ